MNKKICITGHRPCYFDFKYNDNDNRCIQLKEAIRMAIKPLLAQGYYYFISGMAIGVDQWFVEILLQLKKDYPKIFIEAMIPCPNYSSRWPSEIQNRYNKLLEKIDLVHYTGFSYSNKAIMGRNICMVNKASIVMAVYLGVSSGTKNTIMYAQKLNRDIITINPNTLSVNYSKGSNYTEILECSSIGDCNYSAMFAKVKVFNRENSIENFYQLSKRFNDFTPKTIKEAKGKKPTCFVVGNKKFDIKYLTAWYNLLWCKYLDNNKWLIDYAKTYSEFNDKFKGHCINCQADVIRRYIVDGRQSILKDKDCNEFIRLLKGI